MAAGGGAGTALPIPDAHPCDLPPKRVGMVTGGLFQRWDVIIHANITLQVLHEYGSEVISNNNITFYGVRLNTLSLTPLFTSLPNSSNLILKSVWLKIKSLINEKYIQF